MSEGASSCSSSLPSDDTIILSSPETILQSSPERSLSLCSSSWPAQFTIPTFSFDTELILQAANEAYRKDGNCLTNYSVKPNILDKLADSIFSYTAYPSRAQSEALVMKHPCLRDPVSANGTYGWQNSLKYKIGNYRAKVKNLGLPELNVNCQKRNSTEDGSLTKILKKKKKKTRNQR